MPVRTRISAQISDDLHEQLVKTVARLSKLNNVELTKTDVIETALAVYCDPEHLGRRALDLDNRNPLIWGNLADTEMQIPDASSQARDDYQRAIALSRDQLAVNPNDADVLGRMALYLARTANCGEAAHRIGEARRLAPDRVALILKSAKVAETCHNRPSAIRYLDSAIRKGYSRREIEQDPDFNQLRQDPAFAAMRAKTADTKP